MPITDNVPLDLQTTGADYQARGLGYNPAGILQYLQRSASGNYPNATQLDLEDYMNAARESLGFSPGPSTSTLITSMAQDIGSQTPAQEGASKIVSDVASGSLAAPQQSGSPGWLQTAKDTVDVARTLKTGYDVGNWAYNKFFSGIDPEQSAANVLAASTPEVPASAMLTTMTPTESIAAMEAATEIPAASGAALGGAEAGASTAGMIGSFNPVTLLPAAMMALAFGLGSYDDKQAQSKANRNQGLAWEILQRPGNMETLMENLKKRSAEDYRWRAGSQTTGRTMDFDTPTYSDWSPDLYGFAGGAPNYLLPGQTEEDEINDVEYLKALSNIPSYRNRIGAEFDRLRAEFNPLRGETNKPLYDFAKYGTNFDPDKEAERTGGGLTSTV